jgi:hypothetical protein
VCLAQQTLRGDANVYLLVRCPSRWFGTDKGALPARHVNQAVALQLVVSFLYRQRRLLTSPPNLSATEAVPQVGLTAREALNDLPHDLAINGARHQERYENALSPI